MVKTIFTFGSDILTGLAVAGLGRVLERAVWLVRLAWAACCALCAVVVVSAGVCR